MTIPDDFKANVRDEPTLRSFLARHGVSVDVPFGSTGESWFLVYKHADGRVERLMSNLPDHATQGMVYVLTD